MGRLDRVLCRSRQLYPRGGQSGKNESTHQSLNGPVFSPRCRIVNGKLLLFQILALIFSVIEFFTFCIFVESYKRLTKMNRLNQNGKWFSDFQFKIQKTKK